MVAKPRAVRRDDSAQALEAKEAQQRARKRNQLIAGTKSHATRFADNDKDGDKKLDFEEVRRRPFELEACPACVHACVLRVKVLTWTGIHRSRVSRLGSSWRCSRA